MGNEVGREPEGGAQQQRRSLSLRDNFLRFGVADGVRTVSSTAVVEAGHGNGNGHGDREGQRRRFRDVYMLQDRIGTGSHSQVFLAVERATGREVAVKAIDTDTMGWLDRDLRHLEFLRAEISIHREVSGHPFVVDLLGVFEDPEACFIVEELAKGGSLLDHMHSRTSMGTEGEVRLLLRRLLSALVFLHSRHIVHRDIKPENILILEEGVMHSGKLGDFGFATRLDEHTHARPQAAAATTAVGTPEYVAPEVLLQQPFNGKADVWSAGVTAFCLLSGSMPFRGLTLDSLYTAVLDGACSYAGAEWGRVSPRAQDLVRRMLVVDPQERWTARQLLRHPWLVDEETGAGAGFAGTGFAVAGLGFGRRARVRLRAVFLAVMFLNRVRVGVRARRRNSRSRSLSLEQELGRP
eukprot:g9049.t1